jgi:aminoglycoside phosphotransferase (APT) family kinase protein
MVRCGEVYSGREKRVTELGASTADNADRIAAITRWLEQNVGGTVTSIVPQPRWRPVWFAEVERDGEMLDLCVRGERADTVLCWPLNHEMRFQKLLQDAGIKVPNVYGWIEDPCAFVMDRVPGSPNFAGSTDAERDTVVDEYVQELARLHALDLVPFVEAGIDRADEPEHSALIGVERMEHRMYRAQKCRPDPFLEWGLSWFHRHPPQSHGRESAVVWDSGQFHQHNGHLAAILDVEFGHIGDPMMDLAGWRMRDSVIGFGNFTKIYDRYSELTGSPVDLEAIKIHHIAFTLSNQMGFSYALRNPPPAADYTTNLQWCNETNIYATEAIAEYLDVELPVAEVPDVDKTQVDAAHEHLVRILMTTPVQEPYSRYRLRIAFRLARHLRRYTEIGREIEEQDIDDLGRLLGRRPDSWLEGEAELERFVIADAREGRYDDQLLPMFHKRNLRAQMLNGPAGSTMTQHIPIQTFRD